MKLIINLISCLLISNYVLANDVNAILNHVQELYPATDVRSVATTPLPGIYEFNMGGETVYGDKQGKYLILGKLIDMENYSVGFNYQEISDQAILINLGSKGEVVIFSDPNCPYCAQLEQRIMNGELNDYTIKVILVGLLNGSDTVANNILCADDPKFSYRVYLFNQTYPEPCFSESYIEHARFASLVGIQATPSFLAPNGQVLAGLLNSYELEHWVAAGQTNNEN